MAAAPHSMAGGPCRLPVGAPGPGGAHEAGAGCGKGAGWGWGWPAFSSSATAWLPCPRIVLGFPLLDFCERFVSGTPGTFHDLSICVFRVQQKRVPHPAHRPGRGLQFARVKSGFRRLVACGSSVLTGVAAADLLGPGGLRMTLLGPSWGAVSPSLLARPVFTVRSQGAVGDLSGGWP